MGPLALTLLLVPVLLVSAYMFRSIEWLCGALVLTSIGIVFEYFRQYANFAKNDPDRLQSEEYRYEMKKIHIIAGKDLPRPIPLEELNLAEPVSNPANPMPTIESVINYDGVGKGGSA